MAKVCGGDTFYLFTSELKLDQRNISIVFIDEYEREFKRIKPNLIHSNRALRFEVPPYINQSIINPIKCKFYLTVENRNYKSDMLFFYYTPMCDQCCKISNEIEFLTISETHSFKRTFDEILKEDSLFSGKDNVLTGYDDDDGLIFDSLFS